MAGPVPVAAFYGSSVRRPTQPEAAATLLQRASVCRPPRPSLLGPTLTWRVFPRQAAALHAAAATPNLRLMVLGCEERVPDGGGKRSYLVCHPSVFWRCDEQKRPDDRCSYEVIRQGAPCKLYLDLEYDKSLNPDRDGDAMVETFIRVMETVVEHLFSVKCARSDVIDLCASSERKFSRHLIFCCKGLVFCDNITVGNLVRDICDAIRSFVISAETGGLSRLGLEKFSREELSQLLVSSSSENSLFCDEGVYTKNRNFRMYKSSKFGKQRPLIKSAHNTYSPSAIAGRSSRGASSEEAFFLASLVSLVDSPAKPLEYGLPAGLSDTSVCPTTTGRKSCLQNGGAVASPYPDIDAFVRDLVSPGGCRCWNYFDVSELLVYDIVGFRFCHNVGRWHRSNNIIIVVSLRDGSFYQKCHDPACRGFRSDSLPLPRRLLAWQELTDDWEMEGEGGGGGGGADRSDPFPDCGASDTEMLSAAALTEPAAADSPVQSPRRRQEVTSAVTPAPVGHWGTLSVDGDRAAGPVLAQAGRDTPDLFPDCGLGDGELAAMPVGTSLSQPSRSGRVTPSPPGDLFPDCGLKDGEMLEEDCVDRDADDQSTEPLSVEDLWEELQPDLSFPDCGVGDAELTAVTCSGGGRCSPTGAVGPEGCAVPEEWFPDCSIDTWELSAPGEAPVPRQNLHLSSDRDLSLERPRSPDLFPDCGVGDWELSEVGGPAAAAAAADTANPWATAPPADVPADTPTAHTPSSDSSSDQPYHTADLASPCGHVWADLTDDDISALQF